MVRWFDSTFALIYTWGSPGSGDGQFIDLYSIGASPDGGRLYVVDNGNDRVQVFTNTGIYLSQFGGSGTAPGQCQQCYGLAVNNYGLVYVADWYGMIQIYDEYGGFIEEFAVPGINQGVLGICFDIDNNLFVVDTNNSVVHVFGP